MSYFAKKIRYVANLYAFVALVEIAKKKGGRPIKSVLYKYGFNSFCSGKIFEMIDFGANESAARKSFPFGPVIFEELTELEKQNPDIHWSRRKKYLWEKTTDWLYDVAVGGGYQIHQDGDWVRVGRPRRWKDRRKNKNKVLKFGELAHIYMMHEKILENLQMGLYEIGSGIDESSSGPISEKGVFEEEKDVIDDMISQVRNKLKGLKEEMKFVRRKKDKQDKNSNPA